MKIKLVIILASFLVSVPIYAKSDVHKHILSKCRENAQYKLDNEVDAPHAIFRCKIPQFNGYLLEESKKADFLILKDDKCDLMLKKNGDEFEFENFYFSNHLDRTIKEDLKEKLRKRLYWVDFRKWIHPDFVYDFAEEKVKDFEKLDEDDRIKMAQETSWELTNQRRCQWDKGIDSSACTSSNFDVPKVYPRIHLGKFVVRSMNCIDKLLSQHIDSKK